MQVRDDLSPSVVPPTSYPIKRWFSAEEGSWFYHRPRKEVEPVSALRDLGEVDPDLQPLVSFLHLRRIPTTPSCQGHFFPRRHFKETWDRLRDEAKKIRGKGLRLRDVEKDTEIVFRNEDYDLPWGTFDEFYEDAGGSQSYGYLGFYVRDPDIVGHLRHLMTGPSKFNFFREIDQIDKSVLFAIGVRQKDEDVQKHAWNIWTKKVKDAFLGLY